MYLLIKDHKPLDNEGKPASRPVCGASRSINGELSEYLSVILESVAASMKTDEVISGERLRYMAEKSLQGFEPEGGAKVWVLPWLP